MPPTEPKKPPHTTSIPPGRAAEYLAMKILLAQGYTVIRSATQQSQVHLAAWRNREPVVFIRVRRSRKPILSASDVLLRWPDDISQLRALQRRYTGSVQLWIYAGLQGWLFYEVFPGGIAEVEL